MITTMSPGLAKAIGEDFGLFCATFDLGLYEWQQAAFTEGACRRMAERFVTPLSGVSVPRGNGKSDGAARVVAWRFRFGPQPQTALSVGLMTEGAKVIVNHARRIFRAHPLLGEGVEERADGFVIPATGSRWIIRSRDHESSRGEHPDLVTYDECGWASDSELFSSLLASQASVLDPLMLVVSTVGRRQSGPLWQLKELGESGAPGVHWYYSTENGSPRITAAFLERQRRLLLPMQYAREHENRWVDAADSFVTALEVDAAMGTGWVEQAHGAGAASVIARCTTPRCSAWGIAAPTGGSTSIAS
jgi:Phage Terminase